MGSEEGTGGTSPGLTFFTEVVFLPFVKGTGVCSNPELASDGPFLLRRMDLSTLTMGSEEGTGGTSPGLTFFTEVVFLPFVKGTGVFSNPECASDGRVLFRRLVLSVLVMGCSEEGAGETSSGLTFLTEVVFLPFVKRTGVRSNPDSASDVFFLLGRLVLSVLVMFFSEEGFGETSPGMTLLTKVIFLLTFGAGVCSIPDSASDGRFLLGRLDLSLLAMGSEHAGETSLILLLLLVAGTGVLLTGTTLPTGLLGAPPDESLAGGALPDTTPNDPPTNTACFLFFFKPLKPQYRRLNLLTFASPLALPLPGRARSIIAPRAVFSLKLLTANNTMPCEPTLARLIFLF